MHFEGSGWLTENFTGKPKSVFGVQLHAFVPAYVLARNQEQGVSLPAAFQQPTKSGPRKYHTLTVVSYVLFETYFARSPQERDGDVYVVKVAPDSQAEHADIRVGDKLWPGHYASGTLCLVSLLRCPYISWFAGLKCCLSHKRDTLNECFGDVFGFPVSGGFFGFPCFGRGCPYVPCFWWF